MTLHNGCSFLPEQRAENPHAPTQSEASVSP
jgi:hypothetical protein